MATRSAIATGPVSSPSSIRITMTPVSRVAGHDGALDGRRAPPARQQRGVEVEAAAGAARRGSPSAGSARRRRPRRRPARGGEPLLPSAARSDFGVRTGMPKRSADLVHRRPPLGHAAPGRPRRLRVDGDDLVALADDLGQRRNGEVGRADEDDAAASAIARQASDPVPSAAGRSFAAAAALVNFLIDHVALQLRQVVDEQLAVEVVDLVLDARWRAGRRPRSSCVLPSRSMIGDADLRRPLDLGVILRDRQAAFLVDGTLVRRPQDLRVDQEQRIGLGGPRPRAGRRRW